MTEESYKPIPIEVPEEASRMTSKQIILLMKALGVGKKNYAAPNHATSWSTREFLDACVEHRVARFSRGEPPNRTTVDGWFSPNGPVPSERRDAWLYFFHVFFSHERRAFGTLDWKVAYQAALRRDQIARVMNMAPLELPFEGKLVDAVKLLRRNKNH